MFLIRWTRNKHTLSSSCKIIIYNSTVVSRMNISSQQNGKTHEQLFAQCSCSRQLFEAPYGRRCRWKWRRSSSPTPCRPSGWDGSDGMSSRLAGHPLCNGNFQPTSRSVSRVYVAIKETHANKFIGLMLGDRETLELIASGSVLLTPNSLTPFPCRRGYGCSYSNRINRFCENVDSI